MALDFELSIHARDMLIEREIPEEWLWRTISLPDDVQVQSDGTAHYLKAIVESDGRILRVIVNPAVVPQRVITLFFDRRLWRKR